MRHGGADRHDEGAVTLVELLVSLFVLGIVMTGLIAVTLSALRVTQVNDERSVATNVAQAEVERTRELPWEAVEELLGQDVQTVEVDGQTYEVTRDASWVGIDSDTDVCNEPADSTATAVIRLDVSVAPASDPGQVTTTTTTIARPPATPGADVGALSVLVHDQQEPRQPVAAVTVKVVGPEPSGEVRLQTTPAAGCVLFTDLPPGNYAVQVERLGYVGNQPGPDAAAPIRAAGITEGERTAMEFPYAPAGELVLTGTVDGPGGGPWAVPDPLPVTISRDELVVHGLGGVPFSPVWPGSWERWAGDCPVADPLATDLDGAAVWPGADREQRAAVDPLLPTSGTVVLGPVRLNLPSQTLPGSGVDTTPVTVRAEALDDCPEGTPELTFPGAFDPVGQPLELGLPYGTWRLVAERPGGTAIGVVTVTPGDTIEPVNGVWQ